VNDSDVDDDGKPLVVHIGDTRYVSLQAQLAYERLEAAAYRFLLKVHDEGNCNDSRALQRRGLKRSRARHSQECGALCLAFGYQVWEHWMKARNTDGK
jgi:hypothetical protein